MINLGHIQVVQQQIGDAQHIGELLFLNSVDGLPILFRVGGALDLFLQLLQPAYDKAAGAAGKVGHTLANAGPDHLCHKVSQGPGRIELAGGTGALQFPEDRLIDFSKSVALLVIAQVQFVKNAFLPEQLAAGVVDRHGFVNDLHLAAVGVHNRFGCAARRG